MRDEGCGVVVDDDDDDDAFVETVPAASRTRPTKCSPIGASAAPKLKTRTQKDAIVAAFAIVTVFVVFAAGSSWYHAEGQRTSRKPLLQRPQLPIEQRHNIQRGQQRLYCPWCGDPLLCARKFLFIMATGRSGSTTLMATVNSIPGFFLSGENENEASRLRQMYKARVPRDCLLTDDDGAYLNATSSSVSSSSSRLPSSIISSCATARRRELAWIQAWLWESNLPPPGLATGPPEVLGFKEIRWTAEDVQFIQQVAPCSRFILNMRKNATNQARSSFFKQEGNSTTPPGDVASPASLRMVQRANERTMNATKTIDPDRLYALHLEDFSVGAFGNLSAWLGTPCQFDKITHANDKGSLAPKMVRPCRRLFPRAAKGP